MDRDPVDALREQAREWGRALLSAAPWDLVSERVTLLVVDPPTGLEGLSAGDSAGDSVGYWLTIDTPAGRSLAAPYGSALGADRALVEQPRIAGAARVTLSILTDDAMHRLLQGTTRAALEARWQARHHEVVADRMRRGEQYALRAGLLPEDAPERVSRTLFLEAVAAARGLTHLEARPTSSLAAAGEVTAAICRLACFDDSGAYPPAAYLRPAAAETRLGRRVLPWLDDLARAIGGDDAAARRSVSARDQVIEEARVILGERWRDRPWLRTPEAYALRVPR